MKPRGQRSALSSLSRTSTIHTRPISFWKAILLITLTIPHTLLLAVDPHDEVFKQTQYPSAKDCQSCHPKHFEEWSVSPHAYALMSPVFNSLQAKVVKLSNGTEGDFCIRCHTQQGMNLGEEVFKSALDRSAISREGVTCVTCHRRAKPYGKVSGRIGIEEGSLFQPMYGPKGNEELRRVIESGDFIVNADTKSTGRNIHTNAFRMSQITTAGYCGSCHDVNSVGGLRFEEAFSEYKASPAAKKDQSCQDCHMSVTPGLASGYEVEPVAIVGGIPTKPRKRTNHMFIGPDYSIVHPGVFPHNPAAQKMATIKEWLAFNVKEGWGTDDFEDEVTEKDSFPERWKEVADRFDARGILEDNMRLLDKASEARKKLLKVGYQLGHVRIDEADDQGIRFSVEFKNGTDGHNVPTGFDVERLVFLQVSVRDRMGRIVFESGDLDPNGDVRDAHSAYVHNGELPLDEPLFSLQSRFLVRMVRGGEREQVIPVNYSIDPLPFVRPPVVATFLVGRSSAVRKHRMTIPALSSKWATYEVKKSALNGSEGPYRANVKMIAGMVPVNLVRAIQDMGFDFDMSPRSVADAIVDGHQVLWERDVVLAVGGDWVSDVHD